MKRLARFFASATIFAITALTVPSCDGDDIVGYQDLIKTGFPLAVGNTWEYFATSRMIAGQDTIDTMARVTWTVDRMDPEISGTMYRMSTVEEIIDPNGSGVVATDTMWTWFLQDGDTLWGTESEGACRFELTEAQLHKPAASAWNVRVLVYPLGIDSAWTFSDVLPDVLGMKRVTDDERVEVFAGKFDALRVTRETEDFRIDQWFTSDGIVKMVSVVTDENTTETTTAELVNYDLVQFGPLEW